MEARTVLTGTGRCRTEPEPQGDGHTAAHGRTARRVQRPAECKAEHHGSHADRWPAAASRQGRLGVHCTLASDLPRVTPTRPSKPSVRRSGFAGTGTRCVGPGTLAGSLGSRETRCSGRGATAVPPALSPPRRGSTPTGAVSQNRAPETWGLYGPTSPQHVQQEMVRGSAAPPVLQDRQRAHRYPHRPLSQHPSPPHPTPPSPTRHRPEPAGHRAQT